MGRVARVIGLGVIAIGVSRGWQLIQEWRFRLDSDARAEADLIAARDLDAELVGERADDRAEDRVSASGGSSPSRGRGPGPAATG